MRNVIKLILRGLIVAGLVVIGWSRLPHLSLYLLMASGQVNWEAAPKVGFDPPVMTPETFRIQMGALSLALPREVLSSHESQQALCQGVLRFEYDKCCFWAITPRPEALPPLGDIVDPSYRSFVKNIISLEIDAYTADPRSLSIGMSAEQAGWLGQLLEVRRCLWKDVDHIEVIERQDMRGVLVVRPPLDGRIWLLFSYQSPDGALSGIAGCSIPEGVERALTLGRAIIGSIRLSPDSAAMLPSDTEVCPDMETSVSLNLEPAM